MVIGLVPSVNQRILKVSLVSLNNISLVMIQNLTF